MTEDEIIHKGVGGDDIGMLKLFILLYADDIYLLAVNKLDMQNYLYALCEYSMKCILCVNIEKTKVMIFREGGRLSYNLGFKYGNYPIEIVRRVSYLGVVFTHVCNIFDKLIHTILSYGCEIWGFIQGTLAERMHLKFGKQLLGVKQTKQNDFLYDEFGRYPLIVHRQYIINKFWLNTFKGR